MSRPRPNSLRAFLLSLLTGLCLLAAAAFLLSRSRTFTLLGGHWDSPLTIHLDRGRLHLTHSPQSSIAQARKEREPVFDPATNSYYAYPDGEPYLSGGRFFSTSIDLPYDLNPPWLWSFNFQRFPAHTCHPSQTRLAIPLYLPFALLALPTAFLLYSTTRQTLRARRANRANRNLCPHCAYSLAGLPKNSPCPECGTPPQTTD